MKKVMTRMNETLKERYVIKSGRIDVQVKLEENGIKYASGEILHKLKKNKYK